MYIHGGAFIFVAAVEAVVVAAILTVASFGAAVVALVKAVVVAAVEAVILSAVVSVASFGASVVAPVEAVVVTPVEAYLREYVNHITHEL